MFVGTHVNRHFKQHHEGVSIILTGQEYAVGSGWMQGLCLL